MKNIYVSSKSGILSEIVLLAIVVLLCIPSIASAQVIKTFSQRTSSYSPTKKIYNIKGDFTMIGNTNLTLDPSIADRGSNNSNQMVYVDVDGDPNTLNSSSANLTFSAENGAVPDCSNIIYAGLYWTGRSDDGPSPNTFTVTKDDPGVGTIINQDYTLATSNSVSYTNYTLTISRTGKKDYNRVYTYSFIPSGVTGSTVEFIYRNNNSSPTLNVSVDGSTESPVSCATLDLSNAIFSSAYVVYSETGGVILKVCKLSKNGISSSAADARAFINVSGTYSSLVAITRNYDKHIVSLMGPGATSYNTITANSSDIYYPVSSEGSMYSAYAEVTDYVKSHGLGDYFVADIAIREGTGGNTGFYGGWGLIVVYENSKMKHRDVTIFDGHAYVAGNISAQHDLPVTGFNTVQAGEVNMKLGLMAGEGDLSISGDYFKIQKLQTADWITLNHSGNTSTNFFNSSVNTGGNSRNPNISNNTGLDIAMFNIPNAGNSVITNNQTATKFQYGSTQDTYIIFCIAMAVDAYKPQVEGLVSVKEIKRNGAAVSNSGTVLPGDIVTYKVNLKNKGTEAVNAVKIILPITYTGSYIDGSALRNVYFSTPAPAPNTLSFDPTLGANGSVVYNLGILPLDPNPDKVLADLEFSVKVTEDCSILKSCTPDICMNGVISGTGAITGTLFDNSGLITGFQNQSGSCDQEPISAPLCLNINGTAYVDEHCDATPDVRAFTYCNPGSSIPVTQVSGFFPGGSRFYDSYPVTSGSTEYSISNPFPATSGTKNYYAIPPFASDCQFQFTISNTLISTVPSALPISYCQDIAAVQLTATPSTPANLLYYYLSNEPSEVPQLSITPSTVTPGTTLYYVAEGISGQCISPNRTAIAVTVNALPSAGIINTTATTILTCSTPAISVTATGGASYSWSNGTSVSGTTAQLSITAPGTYTVTVTSANGCTDTESVTITEDKSVTAGIINNTEKSVLTCTTPTIIVTANGGVSYSWSNGTSVIGTAAELSITAPGNYTVTVTSANGCSDTEAITITEDKSFTAGITNTTATTILTCTTPTVNITATGGVSYSWTNGSTVVGTSAELSITAPGTYTVTVTSANGCSDTEAVTITEDKSVTAGITNTTATTILTCTTPTVNITANGGVSYSWSNGTTIVGTAAELLITAPGTYTVTVTSANGCTDTESVTITEDKLVTAGINNNTEKSVLTCTTPSIIVTANGGVSYSWSDGSLVVGTAAELSITAPGTYTVTVTSANGCSDTEAITITEDKSVTAGIINNTEKSVLTCTTPTISVTANGGASYSWSNGTSVIGTSAELSITAPGTYTVTVTSANGCTDTEAITITEDKSVTAGIINNTEKSVLTCTTPTISVTANGGVSYSWSNGTSVIGTAAELSITAPGTYTVTVTSANGCSDTEAVTITEDKSVTAGIINNTEKSVLTCTTPTISVTANGGASYSWSNGETVIGTAAQLSLTAPGTYTVTVTSANGCSDTELVAITEDKSVTAGIINNTEKSVLTCTTPSIIVTANGGVSYSWSDGSLVVGTAAELSITAPGTYTVTVTSANGCSDTEVITITEDKSVTAGIINNTEKSVLTCSTPAIIVTANGGVSYSWSDGSLVVGTAAELSITAPGTYTVTVTSANGCSDTELVAITEDKSVTAGIINNTEKSVLTCTIPTIIITATGGASYSWSNGISVIGTAAELSITAPGTYTVTVTSANGCTDTESVTITEDKSVTAGINNNTEKSVLTCTTPSIIVTATGGVTYSWSNGTSVIGTSAELSITAPGTYTVTVTAANGCTDTESVTITEDKSVTAGIINNTEKSVLTCTTPTVNVTATGGVSYLWSDGTSVTGTNAELSITAPGIYTVTVIAANGCSDTETVTITEDKSVTAGIINNTEKSVLTCTTPAIIVTANGGVSYLWSNGSSVIGTAAELSITAPGTYTVTVTSANGCTDTKSVSITQPAALITTIAAQNNVLCFGGATGSATALATGGTSVYRYSWNTSPVQTTATATNLSAGSYTVTVTDANGCVKNAAVNISESQEPLSLTLISKGATRQGSIDGTKTLIVVGGTIRLAVAGGTAPFSYAWTGPGTFASNYQDLTDLSGGTYNVIVTDANGCTKSISAIIEVQIIIVKDETCEIFVPNVFTPNADGVHDYFEIKCLYNYANAEIQIFNRNGNLLFKKDHYGNLDFWGSKDQAFWRGRSDNKLNFMGSELPVGTYYYILKLGNGKALTGFIFLGR